MFLRSVTDERSVGYQEIRVSVQISHGMSIKIRRIILPASCSFIEHLFLNGSVLKRPLIFQLVISSLHLKEKTMFIRLSRVDYFNSIFLFTLCGSTYGKNEGRWYS